MSDSIPIIRHATDVFGGLSPEYVLLTDHARAVGALEKRVAELETALRIAYGAVRAPNDGWKGEMERKACDAIRTALSGGGGET